ncbi:MAG: hypothetical protein ACOVJ5_00565 [Gloeomargaritales cyanobacterium]
MEKINNVFDQQIEKIIDSFPSLYTKDDVVTLVSGLRTQVLIEALEASRLLAEAERKFFISEMDFQEFGTNVTSRLENAINTGNIDVYDYDSAEFSIGYNNQLSIESIDFNSDAVTEELNDILLDEFQKSFGKFITSETEE